MYICSGCEGETYFSEIGNFGGKLLRYQVDLIDSFEEIEISLSLY